MHYFYLPLWKNIQHLLIFLWQILKILRPYHFLLLLLNFLTYFYLFFIDSFLFIMFDLLNIKPILIFHNYWDNLQNHPSWWSFLVYLLFFNLCYKYIIQALNSTWLILSSFLSYLTKNFIIECFVVCICSNFMKFLFLSHI